MLVKTLKPECVWKTKSTLGEGTLWVKKLNSLFFVDIKKKKILILNFKTNKKKILKLNKEIGFIVQIKKNIFILGLKSELRIISLKDLKTLYSMPIESNMPNNRINDGKIDLMGRLWFGTMDNLEKKDFIARQPMNRIGTPEEVASLAVYLASDESDFVTGIVHPIDGGMSI